MSVMASQITGVSIVCSTICLSINQRKYQSSASLAFVRGIHRVAVDSPHKGSVTWKMFSFDDIILSDGSAHHNNVTWASWHLRLLAIELLVQSLIRLTRKKTFSSALFTLIIIGPLWGDPPMIGGFPSLTGLVIWKAFPCYDIMSLI